MFGSKSKETVKLIASHFPLIVGICVDEGKTTAKAIKQREEKKRKRGEEMRGRRRLERSRGNEEKARKEN